MIPADAKRCPACGEEVLAIAKKCKHCGEILDAVLKKKEALKGQTESVVVQVAPAGENAKIAEMECFGWTLANRQEIEREGNTEGTVSTGWDGSRTAKSTTVVTRFVKLQFTRKLDLANIENIREIEAEYSSLEFPGVPGLFGPLVLSLITVAAPIMFFVKVGPFLGAAGVESIASTLGGFLFWGVIAALWFRSRLKKGAAAAAILAASNTRAAELLAQAKALRFQNEA